MPKAKNSNSISADKDLEGIKIFWGRNFSVKEILLRRFSDTMDNLIHLLLLLACLGGLAVLGYHFWHLLEKHVSIISPLAWRQGYLRLFWWSVVGDMYLFFSHEQEFQ